MHSNDEPAQLSDEEREKAGLALWAAMQKHCTRILQVMREQPFFVSWMALLLAIRGEIGRLFPEQKKALAGSLRDIATELEQSHK
jgi:hypothetical protein